MANTLKFGNGNWATKDGSTLAYNDESGFNPLPFDFTRASSATVVNKNGLIETVASGIPRIDFLGNTKGALLLEPQRTNIVTNSELLNTYFTTKSSGAVITDNYGIAPNGLQSSSRIQFGASDYCLRGLSLSTNSTSSVYVKGISGETIQFGVAPNVAQGGIFTFNGSWQRIEFTYQNGSGSILFSNFQGGATATDFEAFGLQVEDDSIYATSYIPTSGGSAVTRQADVCNNGANSEVINSTEGVLYAQVSGLVNGGVDRTISLSDGTTSNYLRITLHANSNRIAFFSPQGVNYNNYDFPQTSDLKVAFQYKENDWKIYINGTLKATDTSALTFSANTLSELAFDLASTNPFFGKTKDVRIFTTALTDAELANLTTI